MSEEVEAHQTKEELVGIRGWLILPAIGMVLSPLLGFFWLFYAFEPLGRNIDYGFGAYSIPRFIVNIGLLIYTCVAAVRFFKKRSNAPRTIIRLLLARVVASFLLFIVGLIVTGGGNARLITELLKQNNFLAQGLAAAVWVSYFRVSKRVKATFVN